MTNATNPAPDPTPSLPRYRCHKEVGALKIKGAKPNPDGSVLIHFEDDSFPSRTMPKKWGTRYEPVDNDCGYLVVYDDGYESWSPTAAFESGYSEIVL